ncbi:glycine--tRNA ligase [Candidatus Hecatella orcuttiae]|uniref:glycine--tRNA ligase n=1 Tax=Candidatus Hecatella orcuttiae TaxID=1935119 RepID=UPI002868291D|nr:glycine--tRNA ligase [Candidatus Hecatella orcuttiae]
MSQSDKCQKIMELAKRRGFFWPSYELYGGESGFIDYGPLGAILKRKIEEKWINQFVVKEGLMLIDTPVIGPSAVFEASGHTAHFTDPIASCSRCGRKWRADHLLEDQAGISAEGLALVELDAALKEHEVHCPECGGNLEAPQVFNELFKTTIGPYSEHVGYGRPETAQGIFVNFKRLHELARNRLPFGVAQVGKCMRNEISPRQGPIRLRELTIMELEFFFDPENPHCSKLKEVEEEKLRLLHEELIREGKNEPVELSVREALERNHIKAEWNAYFMVKAKRFLNELGISDGDQFFKEKLVGERAHYSAQTYDQVVRLSRWGFVEVSGHAWRTDYDLKMHMASSGVDLRAYVQFEKPRRVKKFTLKAHHKQLAQVFGKDSGRVTRLLELTPPEEVAEALKADGRYLLRGNGQTYTILPEHVTLKEEEVEEKGRRILPSVVEPSFGLDRLTYATLEYAYSEKNDRVVLKLPRDVAPIQVAVLPLVSKNGLPEKAEQIHSLLKGEGFAVEYDDAGSIGRRYARMDEAGTPIAVTIDYQTLEDGTVTVRDRNSWKQVRVSATKLPAFLREFFQGRDVFAVSS